MGAEERSSDRLSVEDEACFPELYKSRYRKASEKDTTYNCVALAAGDTSRKWDPSLTTFPGYYWPPGALRGRDPDALKSAFEAIGYELCNTGSDLEAGYEKVALYVDSRGRWTHAARQEPTGEWLSKLGDEEDIRHRTPHCFGGSLYGTVIYIMKRKIAGVPDAKEAPGEGAKGTEPAEGKRETPEQPPSHPA